jgi:hypothetical protein
MTKTDWLTADPPVGEDAPPMPLRMLSGGTRAEFEAKVEAAARWAVRHATLRGSIIPDANSLAEAFRVGLLGWKTADGLTERPGLNPDPVPPAFWPDPVAAREVVKAAVEFYRFRAKAQIGANGKEVSREDFVGAIKSIHALVVAVEDLLGERPTRTEGEAA